ncbi:sigma-70 family RNA polymerase sigma factor [Pseudocolwellia sp. AS88]|uniref:RNA polymerase sigma factor n=1 Tax=Pseudocolwellia sp. AS88 TaxID=3063958 RepID=UPI0026EBE41B|nr:sigma-70 family RNA polymerase sigma factor [Pseudocolwellia sp. AS88]MDO7085582.1 sigma-70 family RNA polymerase sigma factor [Pseudocolwellia sp. AS88]
MKFFDKQASSRNTENSLNETLFSYRKVLLKLVGKIAPSAEVEDIVQDAYVKIFQITSNKKPISYPKAFIYKIAKNLAHDYNKKSEVRLSDGAINESDYGFSNDDTFQQVLTNDEFCQFCEAVKNLPVQCRKVFVMRKIYGFTQKEIAKELNLSQFTVENHTANGMRKCNDFLNKKFNEKQRKAISIASGYKTRSEQ